MHKNWCGKVCADCENPCSLDESIPCSPDCKYLGADGETACAECQLCDALPLFMVRINYDGTIYVRAKDGEDAREKVRCMTIDEMHDRSDGVWDIEPGELDEE